MFSMLSRVQSSLRSSPIQDNLLIPSFKHQMNVFILVQRQKWSITFQWKLPNWNFFYKKRWNQKHHFLNWITDEKYVIVIIMETWTYAQFLDEEVCVNATVERHEHIIPCKYE